VQALQKGKAQTISEGESRTRVALAAACLAGAVTGLLAGGTRAVFYMSYLSAIGGVLFLTPMLCLGLAALLRPVLTWIAPVEGTLAADSLIHSPRRTSATVAALMLSVALVVAFAGVARAGYGSIVEWVRTTLNPDLFVMPSHDISIRTIRFPAEMTAHLEAIQGIRRLQPIRNPRVMFRGTPVMLLATELSTVQELTPVRAVAGTADMFRVAARGDGVLVTDNLAQLHNLQLGEMLELAAPAGAIRLPVVGIIVDYSDPQGAILIDRSLFLDRWRDDSVNFYRVYLDSASPVGDVKRRVLERFAGERQVSC
jgi:putative ABC transport system permease protein